MRKAFSAIGWLCLLGCAGLSLCCGGSKAAKASRDLATSITRSAATQVDPPAAGPIQEQRVYLDSSLSMKGFVNSAHHTQFDDFIDDIGDVMPGCRLFKYGERKGPNGKSDLVTEHASFGLELHRSDFYDLAYNPDDRLIERLADEDASVFSLLITDGVYSEPQGANSPPVVEAIQKWMSRGRSLGVFIFKSAFDGPFYTEKARTMLPRLQVKERPFYVFVFSPTEQALKDLQEKFQRRFPQMQALCFTDHAVSCTPVLNERLKGTYSFSKPPRAPFYWQMFDAEIFAQRNVIPIGFNFKCDIAPDYPLTELKFGLATEYYRWEKGGFKKAESPPVGFKPDLDPNASAGETAGQSKATNAAASPQPDVTLYFPKDESSDYGFYYFRISAMPKEIRGDIRELSTRDDQQPQEAHKTYRFLEFISAVTETHFKTHLASKTSPAIFVTIDNH